MSDDDSRASSPRRSRRRSLRVPLDEVPRRVSVPDAAPAPQKVASAPPRPRTVPPPPPPQAFGSVAPARATDPDAMEIPDLTRTTDPGGPSPDERVSVEDLGDALVAEGTSSAEMPALAPESLASEPTRVNVEASFEGASAFETAPGRAFEDDELAASPTVMMPLAATGGGTTIETEVPSRVVEITEELPEPPRSEPPVARSERPRTPRSEPPRSEPPRSEPPRSEPPRSGPPPGRAPSERPPPELAPSQPPPAERHSLATPADGVIVVQRTIAIGVGTPTHTTTARERESVPPPALSEPAFEISDSDFSGASDVADQISAAPEPAQVRADEEREAEVIDEIEEVADTRDGAPRSAPPPPPAGGPPPPPRDAPRPPPPPKAPPAPPVPPVEEVTGKRARKKWWEEFFNDDYFRTVPPPQPKTILAQTAFIAARLGLPPGATILDVGCGLGLHAIELTRLGYTVVGLDLSLPMLTRAADEAQDQGLKINFIQGDMREMPFEGTFDGVLCWGTTFGYFDDDQNRLAVERLHRALKPGGLLLLDVVNRDYVMKATPNNCWFQGDGCIVMEETNANFINSRLTVKRQVMLDDGRQNETVYSVRLYSLHELGQLLHQRGFRVVEVSGREATPGVFFGAESPRLIITAERRRDTPSSSKRPETDPSSGDSQQLPAQREP